MYCDNSQFPTLTFCGFHTKPHETRGLGKQESIIYVLIQNLDHGICAISRIPCACVACTSMLDKPSISSIQSTKQARYQPVTNCTYWPVLGSYKNWTTIKLTPKSIPSDAFDEIHHVVLDGISENMASSVQSGMYCAIKTYYNTLNGFYVIQFISEAYTLQNNTTINGQVISSGELVFKAQYLC